MGADGILGADERVELVDGELYEMAPIGDDHIGAIISLEDLFGGRLAGRALVSTQNPIRLSDYSEPQPDLVLLRPREDRYRMGKARPRDVLLLIEVAHSSLDYDRLTKLPRYAVSGVVEVWIVNLVERLVEVCRGPGADGYAVRTLHRPGDAIAPLAFPDLTIRVEQIIG